MCVCVWRARQLSLPHIAGGTQGEGVREYVLRKIFGPKKDEVIGEWRRLRKGEIDDLYSPNIIRVIKSKVKWEEERCLQSFDSEA